MWVLNIEFNNANSKRVQRRPNSSLKSSFSDICDATKNDSFAQEKFETH